MIAATRSARLMAIFALMGGAALGPVSASSLSAQATTATARSLGGPLKVVGQPAAVGDEVVVVNLTSARALQLTGVNAKTGTTWHLPYSTSITTPGVYPEVQVAASNVIDLDPVYGAADPDVSVRGIDATTGTLRWELPEMHVVGDIPLVCGSSKDFCIVTYNGLTPDLVVVNATTGHVVRTIPGVERAIDAQGLYQLASSTPAFEELGAQAQVLWRGTVSSLFGPGHSPDFGWDVHAISGLDIGTVGTVPQGINTQTDLPGPNGETENLAADTTVAFRPGDGKRVWSDPGTFSCGGSFDILSPIVLCRFTGALHFTQNSTKPRFENVTLTLEGFNATTGAITWRRPVQDFHALVQGLTVPFADSSHVVVAGPAGLEVLDTVTGATAPGSKTASYWCEHLGMYTVVPFPGDYAHGQRAAAPTFGACRASGSAIAGHPISQPATVGVRVAGMFVWPSASGLEAELGT